MATRCCSPPDSFPGRCDCRSARPTCAQHLGRAAPRRARAQALRAQGHLDVLGCGQARDQVERLEDDADPAPAIVVESAPVELGHLGAVQPHASPLRAQDRREYRQQRGLAASARAEQQGHLAGMDLDVQPVDGSHDVAAAGVLDHQVAAEEAHRDPANDSAGSTPTARRRPIEARQHPDQRRRRSAGSRTRAPAPRPTLRRPARSPPRSPPQAARTAPRAGPPGGPARPAGARWTRRSPSAPRSRASAPAPTGTRSLR